MIIVWLKNLNLINWYKIFKNTKDKIKGKKKTKKEIFSFKLRSGDMLMIEKMAWNTFKNTGNINTFLELKEVENLEKNIDGEKNGNNKYQGNSINGEQSWRL